MAGKWVKAAFLVILGVVLLVYADGLVDDLRVNLEQQFEITFSQIWDLLTILLWILVAWLFVDAVLTIALSFSDQRYSLVDVMRRLRKIEKKLGITDTSEAKKQVEELHETDGAVEGSEEEAPPPPSE
jgi:membrane-anchored protein YejM (alkaline phosphatase superfamily)